MRSYPSRGTPLHRWNTPCVWKYAHVGLITTYSRSSKSWRPTIIVPENRAGFFKTLAGFFLPGTLKTSPAVSMSYWSFFWEESSGIGRFCRLEIHTDGQLARFRFFYRNRVNWTKQAACIILPVSIFLSKLCQLATLWNFELAKSANPTIDSSRKSTNSSLRQQGGVF